MAKRADLIIGTRVKGLVPSGVATIVAMEWIGDQAIDVTYKTDDGQRGGLPVYRDNEPSLIFAATGRPWPFDGDGAMRCVCDREYGPTVRGSPN